MTMYFADDDFHTCVVFTSQPLEIVRGDGSSYFEDENENRRLITALSNAFGGYHVSPEDAQTLADEFHIGSYLNAPLSRPASQIIDALCVLGVKPDGYCFCLNQEQIAAGHTGECREARAALVSVGIEVGP